MDNGSQDKRVIGFEPTTFTLATCSTTGPKPSSDKDLASAGGDARSACAARSAIQSALTDIEQFEGDPRTQTPMTTPDLATEGRRRAPTLGWPTPDHPFTFH